MIPLYEASVLYLVLALPKPEIYPQSKSSPSQIKKSPYLSTQKKQKSSKMKKQQQMTSKKRAQNNTFQYNQINSNHLQHNTKITILKQLTNFVALESTFKLHTIISYNHAINVCKKT